MDIDQDFDIDKQEKNTAQGPEIYVNRTNDGKIRLVKINLDSKDVAEKTFRELCICLDPKREEYWRKTDLDVAKYGIDLGSAVLSIEEIEEGSQIVVRSDLETLGAKPLHILTKSGYLDFEKVGGELLSEGGYTLPEVEANFKQHWELITFIVNPDNSCHAVSTAAVPVDVPFETFTSASAKAVPLKEGVYGMETFGFSHDIPEGYNPHTGKTSHMSLGCIDHVAEIQSKIDPNSTRIITFIYKPSQNGWVAIETESNLEKSVVMSKKWPRANKGTRSRGEERYDQETLYVDTMYGTEKKVVEGKSVIQSHFESIIDEVDDNSGKGHSEQKSEINKQDLKKISIKSELLQ